jgi:hypothetical protein
MAVKKYKEPKGDYFYFMVHNRDAVKYHEYIKFIRNKLNKEPETLKRFDNLLTLLIPKDKDEDAQYTRIEKEITIKTVRHFKNIKAKTPQEVYYFKKDEKTKGRFEEMVSTNISVLIFALSKDLIKDDRDEWIRELIHGLKLYVKQHKIKYPPFKIRAVAAFIAIQFGFTLTNKTLKNKDLFQATRNAIKRKKSKKKS